MQGPPLELHELCKDHLSLGLHLAMQSHKHSTSYKSRGEGESKPVRTSKLWTEGVLLGHTHSANTEYM